MTQAKKWLIAIAAFLACAAGPAGSDSDPASYQLRLPLTPVGNAPVQRVQLPLNVLVASRSDGLADIRVFDGNGRVVPIARMPALPASSNSVLSPGMPILEAAKQPIDTEVTVKVEDADRTSSITIDGNSLVDGTKQNVVGTLFDLKGHGSKIEALILDASIPEGQPITFKVEASEDLKTWRAVGEAVDYRPPGGEEKDLSIAVSGSLESANMLRVTWRSDAPLLAPVTVRQALIASKSSALATEVRRSVSATAPALLDAYSFEFNAPFATPIETIAVDLTGGEGLVPIQIFGRNSMDEAWSLLGQGRAEASSAAIALQQLPIRMIRIEADRRVGGFASIPKLRFGIIAPEIAFVTSGKPPFTLAAGPPAARDVYLSVADISRGSPSSIPKATIADGEVGAISLSGIAAPSAPKQTLILWVILVGVTILLAGIAWHLWSTRDKRAQ
ncbi:MAG: hypothetical protein RL145_1815 [Pseudomonadota bacterium]